MQTLNKIIRKVFNIIAADGFFVFFRKVVRRLYWEFRSKRLYRTDKEEVSYSERMNQITRCLLIKQNTATDVIKKDPGVVVDLLAELKEHIIEVRQEKKP